MAAEEGNKPKKLPPPTWAQEKQVCPQEASGWASIDCWPERLKLPCHRSGFSLSRILHKVLDSYAAYNAGFLNVLLTVSFRVWEYWSKGRLRRSAGTTGIQKRCERGTGRMQCIACLCILWERKYSLHPLGSIIWRTNTLPFYGRGLSSLYLTFLFNSLGFLRASAILKITYRILPLWSSG